MSAQNQMSRLEQFELAHTTIENAPMDEMESQLSPFIESFGPFKTGVKYYLKHLNDFSGDKKISYSPEQIRQKLMGLWEDVNKEGFDKADKYVVEFYDPPLEFRLDIDTL